MVITRILFSLKDEVKEQMNEDAVRSHLAHLIEAYKQVPGLKEKVFFMDPENMDQGAFLIWESQEMVDQYLKSDLYKEAVLDICKPGHEWKTYLVTGSLKDGVLF